MIGPEGGIGGRSGDNGFGAPARRRNAAASFGLPRRTPRALATARASLVYREIPCCFCRATTAIMPTVISLASWKTVSVRKAPLETATLSILQDQLLTEDHAPRLVDKF